jgi:hypothetical protein
MKLATITINSLRAIPKGWSTVSFGDKGLICYGPNGVGKSSLIDAIEFTLTNACTLFPENRLGVSWDKGSAHIKGGKPSVELIVRGSGQEFRISPGAEQESEPIKQWLDAACNSSFVLRRHMLLRFVDSKPKERYSRLEPFLNPDSFLQLEASLKELLDRIDVQLTKEEAKATAQENIIRQQFLLPSDTRLSSEVLLQAINDSAQKISLTPCLELSSLPAFSSKIRSELGQESESRFIVLQKLKSSIQSWPDLRNLKPFFELTLSSLEELNRELASQMQMTPPEFLQEGRKLIAESDRCECPLCEADINKISILQRLDRRIEDGRRVIIAKSSLRERKKALLEATLKSVQLMQMVIAEWQSVMSDSLPAQYEQALHLAKSVCICVDGDSFDAARLKELSQQIDVTVSDHETVVAQLDAEIAKEGGTRRQTLVSISIMTEALSSAWSNHQNYLQRLVKHRARRKGVERLFAHAINARKETAQSILDNISERANLYYEELHPEENISNSKLAIRAKEDGSVHLISNFYGKEAPPLLHLSESHLDTLGLCYFLALRSYEATIDPSFKLLILDDVLHSVDAEHRGRFSQLLKKYFSDHQIILVTHDRYFLEKLKSVLGSGFKYLTIANWDIERGPVLGDPHSDLERIIVPEVRDTKSSEELAGAGGRLLEWHLKQIAESLEISLPARFDRNHDIGSLWPPLLSKLRKAKSFSTQHAPILDKLEANIWVRNKIGAHNDESASSVTLSEARGFAEGIAGLYAATHCSGCGTFIRRKDSKSWRCECAKLSYVD